MNTLPALIDTGDLGQDWDFDARAILRWVRDELGPAGRMLVHGMDIVVLSGEKAQDAFFAAPDEVISEAPAAVAMKPILGTGVSYDADSPEERHKHMRPPFTRTKYLRTYPPTVEAEIGAAMDRLGDLGSIDVVDFFTELMLYVASAVLVSPRFRAELDREFIDCYRDIDRSNTLVAYRDPYLPIERFVRRDVSRARIVDIINEILAARARSGAADDPDLLDYIAHKHRKDGQDTAAEVATSLVVSMLFAAHDTQSTSLAWAMSEAARRPDSVEVIREELCAVTAGGAELDVDALRTMEHSEAFLKEALRVHPPIPFLLRRTETEYSYDSWTIPPRHYIAVAPALSHEDPESFPSPEAFDTGRYCKDRAEDRQMTAWIPFGAGRHRCVGAPLALLTMKIVLPRLLQTFDWYADDPMPTTDFTTMISPPREPATLRYVRRR